MRVGIGYDVHPFEAGRPLVLGGVRFDHGQGLAGHSDGDCLTHAVIDALLGAAALGDIGGHFPSSDGRNRGADSLGLLRTVADRIADAGYFIGNIDVTVVAEAPRLAARVDKIRTSLATALGITVDRISVKATTTDGLGATGRGEGLAAMAVALLEEKPKP